MEIKAQEISRILREQIKDHDAGVELAETGSIITVGDGIARIHGLQNVASGELLLFPGDVMGIALNLEEDNVGTVLFGEYQKISEGDTVRRTGTIASTLVVLALLG